MLDIGWAELLLIGVVALIVVGPKELPGLFRTVGRVVGKARGMAREFQRSLEDAADESGLGEAAGELRKLDRLNLNSATRSAREFASSVVDPELRKDMDPAVPLPGSVEGTSTVETPAADAAETGPAKT